MSVNQRILAALRPLGLAVAPDSHRPEEGDTYITFGYNVRGDHYGDDAPQVEVYACMIHLWAPLGVNLLDTRQSIRLRLKSAGFSWPDEIDAGDEDGQHYVYDCEIAVWIGGGAAWQG